MNTKELKKLDFWKCDNDHKWLSYPGPHKDSWHLEQLHPSETGSVIQRDPKTAWLVAGIDPSICPICALRMRITARKQGHIPSRKNAKITSKDTKISA